MKPCIPQNATAEQEILGCLLLGAGFHAAPLREDHFAAPDHRLVFGAIRELAEAGQPVNVHSVTSRLTAKGQLESAGGPVARFLNGGGAGGDAILQFYFPDLEAARQNREAFLYVDKFLPEVTSFRLPAPEFAEELAARCAPIVSQEGSSAAAIVAEIEEKLNKGEELEVFPMGLRPLDDALHGGFKRGELWVIAGRTGKGKSALLIQAAAANASLGTRVVYVSLEMPRTDVLLRIVSAASGCPMPPNLGGSRKGKEYQGFVSAVCEAQSLPLTIHDGIADLAAIAEVIRNAARHEKAAIVIVDYLQLVECVGDTREQAVSEVARKLKVLAAQEQIAILTASQVNETGQLRESRAIGHHADGVIFIRGDSKDGTIELSKFRRGPLSLITGVQLDGPTSRFVAA